MIKHLDFEDAVTLSNAIPPREGKKLDVDIKKLTKLYHETLKSSLPDLPGAIENPERNISYNSGQEISKEFFIPYNLPEYMNRNGMHPLICEYFPFIRKANWNTKTYGEDTSELFPKLNLDLGRRSLIEFAAELARNFKNHPIVKGNHIVDFVLSRGPLGHMLQPPRSIALMHTIPMMYNKPFVLHIENPITTLLPEFEHGKYNGENISELPIFHLAKYTLESPHCLAVFSHLKNTTQKLGSYFQSNIIKDKSLYCPFEINYTNQESENLRAAYNRRKEEDKNPSKIPVIFFSGSHNHDPNNFFHRGGLDVLITLKHLHAKGVKFKAIIKSALPSEIKKDFFELKNSGADITLVEKPVSDVEMTSLHAQSDIYLLPAAGIHAHSTMRGLSSGNTCIVSDAPQFRDFLKINNQALMVEGQNARIYLRDPKSGWLMDTYSEIRKPNQNQIKNLIETLRACLTHPELRQRISRNAWETFGPGTRTSIVQNGVNDLLSKIQPPSPSDLSSLVNFRKIVRNSQIGANPPLLERAI